MEPLQEEEKEHSLGALPSPEDPRDYIYDPLRTQTRSQTARIVSSRTARTAYASVSESLPEEFTLVPFLPRIRNQGSQGSCVAQTGACIKEYQECMNYGMNSSAPAGQRPTASDMISRKDRVHFSPQFIYNNRDNYPNTGMYGRSLMEFLKNYGVCFEDTFPYDTSAETDAQRGEDIPQDVWREASNHKTQAYARIGYTEGDDDANIMRVKSSLMENGPAYISFRTYKGAGDYFWRKHNSDGEERERRGGHAVAIVGWTNDPRDKENHGFILRNSWGSSWHDHGYIIYPYAEFCANMHMEMWTTVDDTSSNVLKWQGRKTKDGCCTVS